MKKHEEQLQDIAIYQSKDGKIKMDVNLKEDTIWLSPAQMGALFEKSRTTIVEHIKNVYVEEELLKEATCRDFRQVQKEGGREVTRDVAHYDLDMVISVGYRVKSKRGVQFRQWAAKVLKSYLIKGYAINDEKLTKQTNKIKELESTIKILSGVVQNQELDANEAVGLLKVISDYTYALDILDQYDHQRLKISAINNEELFKITYREARTVINQLEKKINKEYGAFGLFGNEKDESFKSSLYQIYQSFGGRDLYPSVEEKAANLLYFIIKNHSFSDGNKRIGAFLFVWFLEKNDCLYRADGTKRIEDNALVAISLMTAQSKSEDKDLIIKLVVNLINKKNT